ADDFNRFGNLEVQGDAALAPVVAFEVRGESVGAEAVGATVFAPRRFDLDDVGAHVTKQQRAEGALLGPGKVEDANAGESGRRELLRLQSVGFHLFIDAHGSPSRWRGVYRGGRGPAA